MIINNEIIGPADWEKRKNIYIINTNKEIMDKIFKKQDLNDKLVININNNGKGNCFFKCINQFFNNSENYHIYYRKRLSNHIDSKKNQDAVEYPYIYGNNNTWMTYEDNFKKIILTGFL